MIYAAENSWCIFFLQSKTEMISSYFSLMSGEHNHL